MDLKKLKKMEDIPYRIKKKKNVIYSFSSPLIKEKKEVKINFEHLIVPSTTSFVKKEVESTLIKNLIKIENLKTNNVYNDIIYYYYIKSPFTDF